MLTYYQQQTQRLLNDAGAHFFALDDLTEYINLARNDVARQTQCLIAEGTLTTVVGQQSYTFPSIAPVPVGLESPINVRNIRAPYNSWFRRLEARPWQWFANYYLDGYNSIATDAVPKLWTQQTQGESGTLWIWPTPSAVASITADAVWYPALLVDDTSPEAIPHPWSECVSYFAAYMALVQAQRLTDAGNLYGLYQKFLQSARLGVTPPWDATNYPTLTPLPSNVDVTATLGGQSKPAQRGEGAL